MVIMERISTTQEFSICELKLYQVGPKIDKFEIKLATLINK